jgi:hypothetical protein
MVTNQMSMSMSMTSQRLEVLQSLLHSLMGAMVLLHRPLMELTTLQMGLRTTPFRLPERRTDRTLIILDISTVNHKRTKPILHTSTHRISIRHISHHNISIRHINIHHISIHLTDLTDPEV